MPVLQLGRGQAGQEESRTQEGEPEVSHLPSEGLYVD